jgi:hypothetical protein
MNRVICGICDNERIPATIIHINDQGQPLDPNPIHSDNYCVECLQREFDQFARPCPTCHQRFLRPDDAPSAEYTNVQCTYKTTRKTKALPNCRCEVKETRLNAEDGQHYCDDHFDLGPAEMALRVMKEQNAREESNANKRKKLAEEQMKETMRRQQVRTLATASLIYQRALNQAVNANGHVATPAPSAPATPIAQPPTQ